MPLKLHRLTATFGRLNNQTLELGPGLNILEAPNESGKSTWCAFLLSMLYGIDSRQRDKAGFIAEKNRYAPWNGTPMAGRLDCTTGTRAITLTRETRRPTAPMGYFTAQFTGSADTVPDLTPQNCGETLLKVSREVYERSAFIRQTGLSISPNAELERRILALVTTGDESTSYTEACAALKTQLNRRKHNRTGEIPAAEADLAELKRQLSESYQLHSAYEQATRDLNSVQHQLQQIGAELSMHKQYDAQAKFAALEEAKQQAALAAETADTLNKQLAADHIPENETIAQLRGAIVNLESTRKALGKARAHRDAAADALLIAEDAANNSPFAGMTPEQAEKLPLPLSAKPKSPLWLALPAAAAGFALAWLVFTVLENLYAAIGSGCSLFAAILLIAALIFGRKRRQWNSKAAELLQKRQQEIAAYLPLYEQLTSAQTELDQTTAAADALYRTLSANEQALLLKVRRFAPTAFTSAAADTALRECAIRRKEAAAAAAKAQETALRLEILNQQTPSVTPPPAGSTPVSAPTVSTEELEATHTALQAEAARLTSSADRLSGQLSAAGDPAILAARIQETEETLRALTQEYDAITLAMDALDDANTTLQNRLSPQLGRRAAAIFQELTDNRYSGVILDRSFRLAAEPSGDTLYRDAQLLSSGTADQLYLAVRLAICETVLPDSDPAPLVLDDALANFDDVRCIAALKWLRKEAEHRQILLFTCHSREAEFFRNDPEVRVQRLTERTKRV